jgi:hypothetical protein
MTKATKTSTQIRIAREIVSDEKLHHSFDGDGQFVIFSRVRDRWEKRCAGSFDTFLRQLIFDDNAWIKDSFRGQARHGRGFDDSPNRQIVALYVF